MALRISILLLFIGQFYVANAQYDQFLGNFPIYNFTNDDFNSPVQIWTGCQTENGVLLFGNDEKIIRFNGKDWTFIQPSVKDTAYTTKQISNKKVYKLFKSTTGIVYGARNNSLGIIKYDKKGNHKYEAFYVDENLKNVWSIDELPNGDIIFINQNNILRYELATQTVHFIDVPKLMQLSINQSTARISKGLIISSTHIPNDSLVKAEGPGATYFLNYTDLSIARIFVEGVSKELSFNFRASVTISGKDFLVDQNHGLLPIKWENNRYVIQEKSKGIFKNIDYVISDALVHEGLLWLATEKDGVVLINSGGEVVREFSMQEGLQDHNVFSFFFDEIGNLWLMLDNGISVIELSSNVVFWDRNQGAPGKVEAVTSDSSEIYLASRSGLFVSRKKNNRVFYENIESINEATFDVLIVQTDFGKRKLVVGYNGIYELKANEKIDIIGAGLYAWKLHQSPTNPNKIYVGGEGFIGYFEITEKGWNYVNLEYIDTEVRFFTSHKDNVYASVQNSGIFKINSSDKITKIAIPDDANFKNSHFTLAVFKDKIYAGSTKGLYLLQQGSLKSVTPIGLEYEKEFTNIHRLYQEPDDSKMWAIVKIEDNLSLSITEIGYFIENDKGQLAFVNIKNKILERGLVYDIIQVNNLLYFGSDKGPYALNIAKFEDRIGNWKVYIDRILVNDTLALKIPAFSGEFQPVLSGSDIRFNYTATAFFNGGDIEYRTRLIGFTDEWSNYERLSFKVYEKLPHGEYTLEIQGRNQYNQESEVYQFTFVVLPPWYLTWWAYVLYFLALIIVLIVTTRVSIYRIKQKNKRLEEIVHDRTKEIANQNTVLAKQRDEITAKTEDILDSIKYAKRLQNTILPSKDILSGYFHDYFVFYRPKDIVSGDFYWARKINGKILWSAIDCTGHGVPGAMVSIVGNNGLLRATNEFQLVKPNDILDKLRELVLESFKAQGTNDVKDGMDLGLASVDIEQMQLEFAGANNSCVIIRNGELIEIKGDKQPIGDFELAKPFVNHTFQLEKGDNIYLFTDGYVDQFGGENEASRQSGGKKFKSKPFKQFLLSISHYDMRTQEKLIVEKFDNWRGEIEAIDDVCVFGVKI
jgi:serine phosphatase RsbU (regulator of sigma subunit)